MQTMARQIWRKRFFTLWFHAKAILCILWKPFTVCRLFGVPVQFHATWFIYPAGFVVWLLFDYHRPWQLYLALLMLFVICVSLLVHEFAHVLTARRFGIVSRRVVIIPLGAVAQLESALVAPSEFWIALAGPLASLLLAGVFWLSYHLFASWHESWTFLWLYEPRRFPWLYYGVRALEFGFMINLMLAGFNIIPCHPMDGGRMLRSALAVVIGRMYPQRAGQAFLIATRITVRYVAWPVALGMMVWAALHLDDWMYQILFPLLIFVAELEYQILCEEDNAGQRDGTIVAIKTLDHNSQI